MVRWFRILTISVNRSLNGWKIRFQRTGLPKFEPQGIKATTFRSYARPDLKHNRNEQTQVKQVAKELLDTLAPAMQSFAVRSAPPVPVPWQGTSLDTEIHPLHRMELEAE
jgi:hypothetical protein